MYAGKLYAGKLYAGKLRHLYRVNQTYYFRLRIPSDLRSWFGDRGYFKRSLHTSNLKNAQELLRAWGHKADKTFTMMRSGYMTSDQIKQLVEKFFRDTLNELEDDRAVRVRNEGDLEEYLDTLHDSSAEMKEALAYSDHQIIHHVAADLLHQNSLELDQKSREFALLCRELLKQLIKVNEIEEKRAVGDYDDVGLTDTLLTSSQAEPQVVLGLRPVEGSDELLSDMIDKYIKDCQRRGRANENSISEYKSSCKLLQQIIGDRPVTSITRDDLRGYHDTLKKLPPLINKKKEYRGKTIPQILQHSCVQHSCEQMKPTKTISDAAISKHLIVIKGLFTWMVQEEVIEKNIADVLKPPPKSEPVDEERKAFDSDDLQNLVKGLLEESQKGNLKGRPERQWIPLIGLFSGMRLNEICQLHTSDVIQINDIWCFKVGADDDGNKRLKTRSSKRTVPIHPVLIDIGFLDYYQSVKDQPRLWMNLTKGVKGYVKNFSYWFLGSRGREGFLRTYMTSDSKKTFHSFRHTFINTLKQLEVQEVIISEIVGHENESITTGRYGKKYEPLKYLEKMELLDYGVDFSVLQSCSEQ